MVTSGLLWQINFNQTQCGPPWFIWNWFYLNNGVMWTIFTFPTFLFSRNYADEETEYWDGDWWSPDILSLISYQSANFPATIQEKQRILNIMYIIDNQKTDNQKLYQSLIIQCQLRMENIVAFLWALGKYAQHKEYTNHYI